MNSSVCKYAGPLLCWFILLFGSDQTHAAGVTLITHGFNSSVGPWIIPMAQAIPQNFHRLGATNAPCYEIKMVSLGGGNYTMTHTNLNGITPLTANTGEIFIKFDWSDFAGDLFRADYNTTQIAAAIVPVLLQTNFLAELGGHALAELPLHLVGHSRGGSLVCEMARLLGAQGVWVDHVTTLDPHPLNNDGNSEPYSAVDGTCTTYASVLFADNYWQNMGDNVFVPNGESILGSYNRQLTSLSGGNSSPHSDVHLWYHGTVDWHTPVTVDGATIGTTQRQQWWTSYEAGGTNAGFLYSLIVGGDRLSNDEPAGAGKGRISDGYNKVWDFGAGQAANRTALPANNGTWPNLIKFDLIGTNQAAIGETNSLKLYYQFGPGTVQPVDIRIFLDDDLNPYSGNEKEIQQVTGQATGTNGIGIASLGYISNPTNTVPGIYALGARISDGTRTRYLYAPELLILNPTLQAPRLASLVFSNDQFRCTVNGFTGQRVVIQASTDLSHWTPLATNTLSGSTFQFMDTQASNFSSRFYRALLQ